VKFVSIEACLPDGSSSFGLILYRQIDLCIFDAADFGAFVDAAPAEPPVTASTSTSNFSASS
jgi:hypothetical protein